MYHNKAQYNLKEIPKVKGLSAQAVVMYEGFSVVDGVWIKVICTHKTTTL